MSNATNNVGIGQKIRYCDGVFSFADIDVVKFSQSVMQMLRYSQKARQHFAPVTHLIGVTKRRGSCWGASLPKDR